MDDDAFRDTYDAVNQRVCPFEKTLLTRQAGCTLAERFCIAEREGVQCGSEAAQGACSELLELLHRQALFLTRSTAPQGARPHALAMRVQVGGLRGIQSVLEPDRADPGPVEDISALVAAVRSRFGSPDRLPFSVIMRHIAAYRGRTRPRRTAPNKGERP
ncbi:hypothetical protein [Imhoffiella purpurea]|uniref:Uncharacterized protein n=1 Tax=Imhoffiella purpurea TaxID=1249627 RepID=W9W2H5_9GAMM|nr:hypothetical protein [Imhoffiella purpurea]EXJ16775.1 hypothetical protein D779_2386 [Imhoffiella purpurea]